MVILLIHQLQSGNASTRRTDPYDVYDYDDPDDFAEEWAEEFGDGDYDDGYDDAYDYWEMHGMLIIRK